MITAKHLYAIALQPYIAKRCPYRMPDVTATAARAKCGRQNSYGWQSISYRFYAVAMNIKPVALNKKRAGD